VACTECRRRYAVCVESTWRFLVTPRWLGWHVIMVTSVWGMAWLCDWQLRRALGGNGLSWAYTFEWPLFAGFAIVFWARTIRDEFRLLRGDLPGTAATAGLPPGIGLARPAVLDAEDPDENDPELAAYNAYLAKLNSEVTRTHGKWRAQR
jgi:hypothetical protein